VWRGLATLITRRVDDGSLAQEFPDHSCEDFPDAITGTDRERFEIALETLIPRLKQESPPALGARSILNPDRAPSTPVALDVVEFAGQYIADPANRVHHQYPQHDHFTFDEYSVCRGQRGFRQDVELIFARNGLAFTISEDDMRVTRLGPPEARQLLGDFAPNTGDAELDAKLRSAHTRFVSRDPQAQEDALKDLWDAFERVKTLELGGNKRASIQQLIDRSAPGSPFGARLEAESKELTEIGNAFHIRHFEHDKAPLPEPTVTAVDYLFTRMLAFVAYLLRQTGRMS
jgi:hypothetical protein